MSVSNASQAINRTIIAVHGVGDQTRYETIKKVLAQFARYHKEPAPVPLGFFNNANGIFSDKFSYRNAGGMEVTTMFHFAEAYWADIPRKMIKDGFQIEDARLWGQTIIGRVETDEKSRKQLREVLKEGLQTLNVLDKLFFLAGKMGIFKFDLNRVIEDNLDDVQVVGDFEKQRDQIVDAFERQVCEAYLHDPNAEIYIVAHSEGTVVSLLGLLRAAFQSNAPVKGLDGKPIEVEDQTAPGKKRSLTRREWLNRVRGYMTIGSPIDKHIALWGHIFNDYKSPNSPIELADKIVWRNYYDLGDPIGFELDDARARLQDDQWGNVFDFKAENEHDFTRSPFPGAAHNAYWTDEQVFGHFIENAIYAKDPPQTPKFAEEPPTKRWARIVSYTLPYVVDFALLFCAVLALYKAVKGYIDPAAELSTRQIVLEVGGIACLLAGLTFIARITRLTRPGGWWVFGALFFLAMVVCYRLLLGQGLVLQSQPGLGNPGFVSLAGLVFLSGGLAGWLRPSWGMRTLLIPGGVAVLAIVVNHLLTAPDDKHGTLWPVFLATAFFLYLWWLVALVFDLVFVWHWYIRSSRKNFKVTSTREWRQQMYR